jgi:hypothetical protein
MFSRIENMAGRFRLFSRRFGKHSGPGGNIDCEAPIEGLAVKVDAAFRRRSVSRGETPRPPFLEATFSAIRIYVK